MFNDAGTSGPGGPRGAPTPRGPRRLEEGTGARPVAPRLEHGAAAAGGGGAGGAGAAEAGGPPKRVPGGAARAGRSPPGRRRAHGEEGEEGEGA